MIYFLQHMFLASLSNIKWLTLHVLKFGSLILFNWSTCLFLWQCHIVFNTVALWHILRSGMVMPPALPFCSGLFWFSEFSYGSIWILELSFLISVNNEMWILIGMVLNLQVSFGKMIISTVLILPISENETLFSHFSGVCLFLKSINIFTIKILHPPWLGLFLRHFISLKLLWMGVRIALLKEWPKLK